MPILLYDGDCAFCSTTIRLLQKWMARPPRMVPFQFTDVQEYGLTKQECSEEIKFVDASMQIHGGEAAFKKVFFEAGGFWRLFGGILATPIIRQISAVVYRWVAKNRHSLPGGTPACAMPRKYDQ